MHTSEYEVRQETAVPRTLAAVRGTASRANLGGTIMGLLDRVWPVLRQQQVPTGHNVVVYLGGLSHIEVGVEVFGPFSELDDVHQFATPAGPVATVAYWGEYSQMAPAYAALEQWCATNNRQTAGPSWEVYGDWNDDPRQLRTDIFFLLAPPSP